MLGKGLLTQPPNTPVRKNVLKPIFSINLKKKKTTNLSKQNDLLKAKQQVGVKELA